MCQDAGFAVGNLWFLASVRVIQTFPPRPSLSILARFKVQTERSWSPRWRQSEDQSVSVVVWYRQPPSAPPPRPPGDLALGRTASHTGNTNQNGQYRVFHEAEFKIKCLGLLFSQPCPSTPHGDPSSVGVVTGPRGDE